jgi:sporulation protein YlmC with PRC-barrel domain
MATATVHSNDQLVSSEDVEGAKVYDVEGKKVGEIDHLMIDKATGRVTYAVMSFGGLLGVAHRRYSLPWPTLKYNTKLRGYQTNVTEQQLRTATIHGRTGIARRERARTTT